MGEIILLTLNPYLVMGDMGPTMDILVVDDSPHDGNVFQEALGQASPEVSGRWLASG